MMACGKHVITTNYSGHTEFASSSNSFLIQTPNRESAYDGVFFHNQGEWAAFDDDEIEQLVYYMRLTHKKVQDGTIGINETGLDTARAFTWDRAVKKLLEVIA